MHLIYHCNMCLKFIDIKFNEYMDILIFIENL